MKTSNFASTKYTGVYRRGATFSFRISGVPRRGGTKGDLWKGGFRTAGEARDARNETLTALKHKTYVGPSKMTVAEFLIEKWLPGLSVRPSTRSSYEQIVEKQLVPRIGNHKLEELDAADLNRLYAELLTNGRKDGAGLSLKSVRNTHVVIRKALSDALRWGLLSRNVATLSDPPKHALHGSKELKTWDRTQLNAFLEGVKDDRLCAAYRLAAMTGMRRGEVLGLRWKDLDLENRRLAIRQTLISIDYRIEFSSPKTKRSCRSVALDEATASTLRSHKSQQARERLRLGPAYEASDLVFTREDGTPLHPDLFSDSFEKHASRLGLDRIRLHDLRHTFATLGLQAGLHPKVVSETLGHASVAFTMDVYSHAIPSMQEEAAEVFAALIEGS